MPTDEEMISKLFTEDIHHTSHKRPCIFKGVCASSIKELMALAREDERNRMIMEYPCPAECRQYKEIRQTAKREVFEDLEKIDICNLSSKAWKTVENKHDQEYPSPPHEICESSDCMKCLEEYPKRIIKLITREVKKKHLGEGDEK